MTAALLCLAAGILAWPEPAALRRARLSPVRRRLPTPPALGPVGGPALAAGAAAALAAAASTPLVAVLAACCAGLAARAWGGRRRGAREDARAGAVTELLGVLAAELRSGMPPEIAAAAAARSGGDEELGRALLRTVRATDPPTARPRAGPVDEALDRLAAAVRLSARTGASLADVVTAVEDDLRARQRHRLELRSAVAAPRASAALLAGLPVVGLAMGSGVGADPWHVLTATATGQVLLVAGVGLEIAGVTWSRRLVARATRGAAPAGR
ncbi:type II secretion system F family protein [Geodermatophilus sp. URMC 64]